MTLEISGTGKKARAEGVVVECEAIGTRLWSITLLFLGTPVGLGEVRAPKVEVRGEVGGTLLT
jgi:hypothetical protein